MPTPGSPTMLTTWPEPDLDLLVGLREGSQGMLAAYEASEASGHGGLDAGFDWAQPEQLVGVLGLFLALDGEGPRDSKEKKSLVRRVGVRGDQDGAGLGQGLHAGGQVGGVPDGGVVHAEVIADLAHHYRTGVEADAELERETVLSLDPLPVALHRLLDGQGGMTGPLGMVLVGQGGAEEGHHPVAGELVDGALVAVDLGHQDLEAPVHDLVDLLGVQLLGEGGVVGHVREEDGDDLALPLYRGAGGEDLIGQVLGGVGGGMGGVEGRMFFRDRQLMTALLAEFPGGGGDTSAFGAAILKSAAAFNTELSILGILKLALGALHFPSQEIRLG